MALVYVDDGLGDGGDKRECDRFCSLMEDKFDCKDTVWVKEFMRTDYLGMEISMDSEFSHLSMVAYIENSCATLFAELANSRPISTPIDRPIELESDR